MSTRKDHGSQPPVAKPGVGPSASDGMGKIRAVALSKAAYVAVGSGLLSVALGWLYMNRFESDVSGGSRVAVLTTNKEISNGTELTSSMIAVRRVPAAYVDERAVLARDQEKVIGVEVVTSLKSQETLQWTDLAVRTDARNVSQLIAPGKRAVSIRARASDNAGNGLMQPGDYVDVFAVVDAQGTKTAVLLLQRVLVIAVGLDTEQSHEGKLAQDQRNRRDDRLLTLSLDVDETQLLSLAADQGRLAVALRNPTDQRVFENTPDLGASALVEARDKLQARKANGPRPPAAPAASAGAPLKLTEAR
jgi:pilus assembly protein CpaB